jgi:hypothetical protein
MSNPTVYPQTRGFVADQISFRSPEGVDPCVICGLEFAVICEAHQGKRTFLGLYPLLDVSVLLDVPEGTPLDGALVWAERVEPDWVETMDAVLAVHLERAALEQGALSHSRLKELFAAA